MMCPCFSKKSETHRKAAAVRARWKRSIPANLLTWLQNGPPSSAPGLFHYPTATEGWEWAPEPRKPFHGDAQLASRRTHTQPIGTADAEAARSFRCGIRGRFGLLYPPSPFLDSRYWAIPFRRGFDSPPPLGGSPMSIRASRLRSTFILTFQLDVHHARSSLHLAKHAESSSEQSAQFHGCGLLRIFM